MTSRKPYLIRAIHEWILDNQMTPYLSVNASIDGVVVPSNYIVDDSIVLNISPSSVRQLELGNDFILFDARFSGQSFAIEIPLEAVQAIYARENGEGMLFVMDDEPQPPDNGNDGDEAAQQGPKPSGKPTLKVIK
ncbi:MAG: ClpXP protease specificity-enhancing factor [Gammaproteobacteria bacterium]|nr:MAG: ClpXP protease specificity-enhancing factor [Gammaproteobacteria bacterium]